MTSSPDTLDALKQQLSQLKDLHASGVLPTDKYEEGKAQLERRILDMVLAGSSTALANTQPAAPAPSSGMSPRAAAAAYAATAAATQGAAAPSPARPSALLLTAMAVGVLAIALAGYAWKGSPGGATQAAQSQEAPSHDIGTDQIAAMTEKLAERMQSRPDDVEGWTMLARSYSVLGRHPEALKAFEKAVSLRGDDASLLADLADSMAVNQNSDLTGEPMKLIERALKLDPKNLKALYLAGTQAFNTKDYANAVKIWEKMVQVAPADSPFAQQVEPAIAEARSRAGMPAAAKPLDAALPGKSAGAAAPSSASVSGTVTLSAALAKQAQPEDTVFVFARAAEGSRMPLAIVRKQVKDLPFTFTLDDSMAMSPASALSTASKVIVGARVSKSGNAMPQPGDLAGQSEPVSVGASKLTIEIKEAIKP